VLSPPLIDAAATSHKSLSKFLIATKSRTTIATHQKLGFHVILRLWLYHVPEDMSHDGNG
jgi:hypothetical protein